MIEVGRTYTARYQGKTITPQFIEVTVVWVENGHVHYRRAGETEVRQTPIERFVEIVE
ncbi:hypothetical protein HJB53_30235 [Rhizobium lentis]|uniref:hypothetical protein n=1 Tax=Rhizobium lentis TaxID=1138194 RepID=UPI001C82D3D4|nr:hypothetical protein [Rhizobium lentis]MBX5130771.1 hypothetical protein [Rhizobium lentis]